MDKKEKLDLIDKLARELDDLKNSQTSVMKKIGQIEADNINLDAPILNKELPIIFDNVDKNVQLVTSLQEKFTEYREKFFVDNKMGQVIDPTA